MRVLKSLWVIFLLLSTTLSAQGNDKGARIDEMRSQKWKFLCENAKLSASEIAQIHPIFVQYEKQMWEQHQQNRDFFKKSFGKNKGVKPDYSALNDRYIDMEVNQSQLLKAYHLQLRKLVLPETLYRYYKAERDFKRKLLQGMPDHSKHKEHK